MTPEENWQRARTDEQKQQRVNALINAANVLFDRLRYDEITIVAIAMEAGFTRSNTYKYFSSKEEIFLELLMHDFALWSKDVTATLEPGRKYSTDSFAMIWTGLLLKHFRLIRLFSVLFSGIEKNLTEKTLIGFKRFLLKSTTDISLVIVSIYPELKPEEVIEFFNLHMVSVMGLFQMTELSDTQKIVMSHDEFSVFRIDLGETCRKSAKYLLEGLLRDLSGS